MNKEFWFVAGTNPVAFTIHQQVLIGFEFYPAQQEKQSYPIISIHFLCFLLTIYSQPE
jgi:hypothetical protein